MNNKAKRGKAFDKINRQPSNEREKYLIIGLGKIDDDVIEEFGLSKAAASFISTSTEDGGFTLVTGYCNDPKDTPDVVLLPEEKSDMVPMSAAWLTRHFFDFPGRLVITKNFDESFAKEIMDSVFEALNIQFQEATVH